MEEQLNILLSLLADIIKWSAFFLGTLSLVKLGMRVLTNQVRENIWAEIWPELLSFFVGMGLMISAPHWAKLVMEMFDKIFPKAW